MKKILTYTHGVILLHTLLVKYYNDLLGRQNSEWGMDKVTFFYVGELFCIHLGIKYAKFQEKMPKLFIVVTLLSAKVYTKKVPNIKECNFIHAPLRILSTKQVIVILY